MNHAAKLLLLPPLATLAALSAFPPCAAGQNIPAARGPAFYTGFHLPDISGTLRYSLTGSERIHLGATNGYSGNTTNFSGNVAYLSVSADHPFSLVYSGAYLLSNSARYPSEILSNLHLSQVLPFHRYRFIIADSINYLPETPSTGLSGVPGLGDVNVAPVAESGQDVLTTYAQRITNRVSATLGRELTARTNLSASGSQSIIRYLDVPQGSTVDANGYSGNLGLNHQFSANTGGGFSYAYNKFTYLSYDYGITSQSVRVQFQRTLTPRISFTGSIGPQHVSSSNSALIAPRTSLSGSAGLNYVNRPWTFALTFSEGASSGSGLVAGSEVTSLHFTTTRQFGRSFHASANAGYISTSSLQGGLYNARSIVVGVQANRSITRHLSGYTSYTVQHQINSGFGVPSLALSGLNQSLAFGLTFAPEAIHLGH